MVRSPSIRRFISPSLLALALAIGTVSSAVGRDEVIAPATDPAAAAAPALLSGASLPTSAGAVLAAESAPNAPVSLGSVATLADAAVTAARRSIADTRPVQQPAATAPAPASSSRYTGRNHVWMPSLKIDKSVAGYACSRSSYPGNRVYRWGCAGKNNVYLFGHAHSVFKPLHDAYVKGRLKKGAKLYYADSSGRVRTYKVAWWKVTTPTKGTWAYAPQPRRSVTLQTCVGSKSQYRLIVRLTEVS
jgi:sortase (surface protein transpeptidase)